MRLKTHTYGMRAIEASVKAVRYQEQFHITVNFLKGSNVFVSSPTGGAPHGSAVYS